MPLRSVLVYVDHLQLADFRSYSGVDVPLGVGVTTFVGANGQGKTNLVEAIEYLSTLGSHRVASEAPLVRAGAERAILRARVQAGRDDDRSMQLEIEISPGKSNRAKLNRSPLQRPRELLGLLRTVVFSPEDLAVVKGDPGERRRFLDALVISRWPRLAGVKSDYDRVLRQRNTLLKSLGGRRPSADTGATLDVWDTHLAAAGAALLQARLRTLVALQPLASKAYAEIAPTNNVVDAQYRTAVDLAPPTTGELADPDPTDDQALGPAADRSEPGVADLDVLQQSLVRAMADRRGDEIQRGVSLVGPHRDDIALTIGDLPARGYASHGESWSLALALKLGSFALLRSDGIEPVLVLDDVFAELDTTRRDRLASQIRDAEQVLITAAVLADVPPQLTGTRYRVADGAVAPDRVGDHQDGPEPSTDPGQPAGPDLSTGPDRSARPDEPDASATADEPDAAAASGGRDD